MKKPVTIYSSGDHRWVAMVRDPDRPGYIIDTNEYLIIKGERAALLDPGGQEIFPAVFGAVTREVHVDQIDFLFASHQDPDISSSLPLWLTFKPDLKCHVSWLWQGFLPHFGGQADTFLPIPDEGKEVMLGPLRLHFLPAHYLHSSGNFNVYDPAARILFTGDLGAALLPPEAGLFVTDFSAHIRYMETFHRRWMPSDQAKEAWINMVSKLELDMLCPQHGAILRGEDVARFLEWLRSIKFGAAIDAIQAPARPARGAAAPSPAS